MWQQFQELNQKPALKGVVLYQNTLDFKLNMMPSIMKPKLKCLGFTYNGAKLFNMLPCQGRETKNPDIFKTLSKEWIWENIPSY